MWTGLGSDTDVFIHPAVKALKLRITPVCLFCPTMLPSSVTVTVTGFSVDTERAALWIAVVAT